MRFLFDIYRINIKTIFGVVVKVMVLQSCCYTSNFQTLIIVAIVIGNIAINFKKVLTHKSFSTRNHDSCIQLGKPKEPHAWIEINGRRIVL